MGEAPAAVQAGAGPWPPFHPHADVWLLAAGLVALYLYALRRLGPRHAPAEEPPASRRQIAAFLSGVGALVAVSGWPVHDIAEQSLFSAHMLEHMVLGLVVPPLLLVGIPAWLGARLVPARWLGVVRAVTRPVPAFVAFNLVLVAIHWPEAVELMVTSDGAHFLIHALFVLTALAMWMPVFSPIPQLPPMRAPMRMLYLFLGSIVPTVPASFLTFGSEPIYPVYGDAASAWGVTAVIDQTSAGLLMKLGGGLLLWGIVAVIWFRWSREEQRWDALERELHRT